ncbi:hypothetical protein [Variovorax sp. SRS16]|uniref:hypothetical protein n=1 Tax=Variovorax sp. SRS16 TaxID=282217 RepID=UPI0013A5A563|nr:hypothetical protein [Variovorax sp. SRS16]
MASPPTPAENQPAYRILMRERCRIVYGHMPLPEFLVLLKLAGDAELLHPGLARMLGATAVIGRPEALDRLRAQETPAAIGRIRFHLGRCARRLDLPSLRWLVAGEQGSSSLALFALLTGIRPPQYRGTALDLPHDAKGFRCCRLLIEQAPALRRPLRLLAARMHEPEVARWAAVAEAWSDLCAQMDHELPDWRAGAREAPVLRSMLVCFRELDAACFVHSSRIAA